MNLGNLAFEQADELAQRERDTGIARARAAVSGGGSEFCAVCGRPIGEPRRRAAPFTRLCLSCKEDEESGER